MAGTVLTWSSSEAGVAGVDATGLVTAAGNGTATITAATGSATGSATVVVEQEALALSLTPEDVAFRALGDTLRLLAEGTDANGHPVEVTWSSSDAAVATVDPSGLVTAAGNGTATITATAGRTAAGAAVSVEQEVVALSGLPAADTLLWYGEPGDTLRLLAEAVDANGHPVEGVRVGWSSSLALVAPVDSGGLVRGLSEGVTTITATADSLRASTELTVIHRDRAALTALYHATGGPNWRQNENWLSQRMQDWEGVYTELRDDGVVTVTGLALPGNNLTGPIPPELGNLASLDLLLLPDNQLMGPIPPELGNLANLGGLLLWDNQLTGPIPPELGNLAMLGGLWLDANDLTGPIPSSLGSLANLRDLSLRDNGLIGPIPPELRNLARLEALWVSNNDLSGPIPSWLGRLANLRSLSLWENAFAGPIPPELGNLARLEELLLDRNALTGSVPSELGHLSRLQRLELGNNQLSGSIPPEIGNLTELERLTLHRNRFSGALPQTLTNLPLLLFLWNATELCSPPNETFQRWLQGISLERGGGPCAS